MLSLNIKQIKKHIIKKHICRGHMLADKDLTCTHTGTHSDVRGRRREDINP